jgi:hypothetical protein
MQQYATNPSLICASISIQQMMTYKCKLRMPPNLRSLASGHTSTDDMQVPMLTRRSSLSNWAQRRELQLNGVP